MQCPLRDQEDLGLLIKEGVARFPLHDEQSLELEEVPPVNDKIVPVDKDEKKMTSVRAAILRFLWRGTAP